MTPFLITPKMIEGEMYCCTLDGMRRTVGVSVDVEGNSAIGGDGPWFMGDDVFGAGEFGEIIFATCCGTSLVIGFTFTKHESFSVYSYQIIVNNATVADDSEVSDNTEVEITLTNRPCGNFITILTTTESGSLTANATVV